MKLAGHMELFEILLDLLAAAVDHNHVMMLVLQSPQVGRLLYGEAPHPSIGFPPTLQPSAIDTSNRLI